jgi:hypothetical protein
MRDELPEIVAGVLTVVAFICIFIVWDWVVCTYLGGWGELWHMPQ